MTIKVSSTVTKTFYADAVAFTFEFVTEPDTLPNASGLIFSSVSNMVAGLVDLGIPKNNIESDKIQFAPHRDSGLHTGSTVVKVVIPYSWISEDHKLSDIITMFTSLPVSAGCSYKYTCADMNACRKELRKQLIAEARQRTSQLVGHDNVEFKSGEYTDDMSILHSVESYGTYFTAEELPMACKIIDILVNLKFNPRFELKDTISTEWTV